MMSLSCYGQYMCGRLALHTDPNLLALFFGVALDQWEARYNIGPSQSIPGIIHGGQGRRTEMFQWGLQPEWLSSRLLINARSETAHQKPVFRDHASLRRGLVPADGFYEWQREGAQKVPWYFTRRDGAPMAMGALWAPSKIKGHSGSIIILTTSANAIVNPLHNRMPVLLSPGSWDDWLDPLNTDFSSLNHLTQPASEHDLLRRPCSPLVNSVKNEGPELLQAPQG